MALRHTMEQVLEFMINPHDTRCTSHWDKTPQFFLVEIHALAICAREKLERGYKKIQIQSVSQAAIKALASHCISSQLVWDNH